MRLYPRWELVQRRRRAAGLRPAQPGQPVREPDAPPWRRELVVDAVPERLDDHDVTTQLDDRERALAVLRTLPDRQRTALVLRYFHDLPDDEIAARPRAAGSGTVRSLISRGLAALRERRRRFTDGRGGRA